MATSAARGYLEEVVRCIIADPFLTTNRMRAEALLCSMVILFVLPDELVMGGRQLAAFISQTAGMWSPNYAEGAGRVTAYRLEGCQFGKHIVGNSSSSQDLRNMINWMADCFGGTYRYGRGRLNMEDQYCGKHGDGIKNATDVVRFLLHLWPTPDIEPVSNRFYQHGTGYVFELPAKHGCGIGILPEGLGLTSDPTVHRDPQPTWDWLVAFAASQPGGGDGSWAQGFDHDLSATRSSRPGGETQSGVGTVVVDLEGSNVVKMLSEAFYYYHWSTLTQLHQDYHASATLPSRPSADFMLPIPILSDNPSKLYGGGPQHPPEWWETPAGLSARHCMSESHKASWAKLTPAQRSARVGWTADMTPAQRSARVGCTDDMTPAQRSARGGWTDDMTPAQRSARVGWTGVMTPAQRSARKKAGESISKGQLGKVKGPYSKTTARMKAVAAERAAKTPVSATPQLAAPSPPSFHASLSFLPGRAPFPDI